MCLVVFINDRTRYKFLKTKIDLPAVNTEKKTFNFLNKFLVISFKSKKKISVDHKN